MKLALHTAVFGLFMLLSGGLMAQEEVNVATIAEINVTLNDNCQDSVILEEILAGDFDVDGNGIAPDDSAFTIVVQDGDESNGPIIDGCGQFTVRVTADPALVSGFTTGWSLVNGEDKTPPFFTTLPTAPAGPLYCDAIEGVELGTLGNTISRCYTYNTVSESIVGGTLNGALRSRLLAGGGIAIASDACSEIVEICVNDIVTRDALRPDCEDVTITRTFTATDGSCVSAAGEANPAEVVSYDIVFTRPGLDDLNTENIEDVVTIECDELAGLGLEFGEVPAPRSDDLPFFDGPNGTRIPLTIGEGGSFCGIGVTFEDSNPIVTCPRAYKVVRTYTIIDWCNPADIRTLTQVVKVGDFTAPTLDAPAGPIEQFTNAGNECGAFVRLDIPGLRLTDGCSDDLTLVANVYPNGDLAGRPVGSFPVNLDNTAAEITTVLPVGNHIIRYTFSDDCGNADNLDIDLIISDGTPPTAICEDGLNVSLSSSVSADPNAPAGLAVLTPSMIDAGSFDDCSATVDPAIARVRQLANGAYELLPGAAYGPTVVLTCDDLGEVLVGLRVEDAGGLANFCWMTVLLEDKTAPVCTAPADITIGCIEFNEAGLPNDITEASDATLDQVFGVAFGTDNCSVSLAQSITGGVNSCSVGQFVRTFTTTDGAGFTNTNVCTQEIEVVGVHAYTISLPGDAATFCSLDPTVGDFEIIESGSCDLITTDVSRDTFTNEVDACFKIRLQYEIINWCEYNTLGEPYDIPRDYDGDNNLRERTFLYVRPNNPIVRGDDEAYLDNDADFNNNNFALLFGGDDGVPYGLNNSRGAFRYTQFVKISDEVAPEIVARNQTECFPAISANCTGDAQLSFEVSDNCTTIEQLQVRIELDADYVPANGFQRTRFLTASEFTADAEGNYTLNLSNLPIGEHAVRVNLADGCGNVDNRIIEFCLEDALAPTPICIMQTTVSLGPDGNGGGEAAYWASDALASSTDDCSGEVTYSIYKEQETFATGFEPAPGRDGIIFNCDDDATSLVRVYAFDPAGRNDFCSVLVLVQRAENACAGDGNLGSIAGAVTTSQGVPVSGVSISLTGRDNGPITTLSSNDGLYSFDQLRIGADYTIDPDFESYLNHGQGVSTFDLVLMTQHILGASQFTTPYQHVAADANGSGNISVQDIIAISRLILGLDAEYPNSSAWRFVDANFIFPVNSNPWATTFPEIINLNNLDGSIRDGDFIAIMVGDVSGNRPGAQPETGIRPRSGGIALSAADVEMKAGQAYDVAITAGEAAVLNGLQGTFSVTSGTELLAVNGGQFTTGNFNDNMLSDGQLPFSYAAANQLLADEAVVTLTLRSDVDTKLSKVLRISDEILRAEAYTTSNQFNNLTIDFTSTEAEVAQAELLQNTPNPVLGSTTIAFRLPAPAEATVTVRDMAGRVVLTRTVNAAAGLNRVAIDRNDLGAAGVFTYTLTTDGFTASRKLIAQ